MKVAIRAPIGHLGGPSAFADLIINLAPEIVIASSSCTRFQTRCISDWMRNITHPSALSPCSRICRFPITASCLLEQIISCSVIRCAVVSDSPHVFTSPPCLLHAYLPRSERRKTARRLLVKARGKQRKTVCGQPQDCAEFDIAIPVKVFTVAFKSR